MGAWARGGWKLEVSPSDHYNNKFRLKWKFEANGRALHLNVTSYSSGTIYSKDWVLVRDKPSGAVGVATYVTDSSDGRSTPRIFFRGGLQIVPTSNVGVRWGWKPLK